MNKLNIILKKSGIFLLFTALMLQTSCTKDLLDQQPTGLLDSEAFWKSEADATTALMSAYAAARGVFDRDYYFDGHGEYTRVRGTSTTSGSLIRGDAYNGGNYNPSGYGGSFDKYFQYLYGAVNRANYVIENINRRMLP
ncbi:MAG: RagB/SusD family nutrient uptake outer membrane protein, partial [Sphingobacteriales bacterium]